MDIGMRIDELYRLRAQRLELAKQVDELKMKETIEKEAIRNQLDSVGLAKATGSLATAGVTCKRMPVVEDWDQVFAYMVKEQAFDIVERRLARLAWSARLDDGILIPGTQSTEVFDLSLTKSTRG